MEKRFIYIGILMIVLFLAVIFAGVPAMLGLGFNHVSFAIAPGHDAYSMAQSNSTYLSTVVYNSSSNLDFYVANATAFNALLPYLSLNESLMNESLALEGKGMLEIINNSRIGEFPISATTAAANAVLYANYNSTLAAVEPYYLLFENRQPETANVLLLVTRIRNPTSNAVGFASVGIGMLVLLLFGIGFIAYGLFKKPRASNATSTVNSEDVDALYKKIEGKSKKD